MPSRKPATGVLGFCTAAGMLAAFLGLTAEQAAGQPATPPSGATPIEPSAAAQIFREARQISDRDGGALWGVRLYGPMMFVEPASRFLATNQADAHGALKPAGEIFTGTLPPADAIANTAVSWSGVFWTQIMWPLTDDAAARDTLIAHELFHRIRDQLHLPPLVNANNSQLDTLQGRYLLQLEWRALSRALDAPRDADRRAAVTDALLFRARRYQVFQAAAEQESGLEYNEGLAEYTGVKAGLQGRDAQVRGAQQDLHGHAKDSSFVRSFAYATGPAYGLLLDQYRPAWRQQLAGGERLDLLLAQTLGVSVPRDLAAAVALQAVRYDGATLLQAETLRDGERQKRFAQYRATFIEGAVLVLPLTNPAVSFDPREVQSFDEHGNVYPHLHASDGWGTLEVSQGALAGPDWHSVVVAAPARTASGHVTGEGWTLDLKPGWTLVAGARPGDFTVAAPKPTPQN